MKLTRKHARKVLEIVDAGLVSGVGTPQPGKMCVEAAVCYALGLPHGDDPPCVSRALRSLKIALNDANWSSDAARAKGMRRLAIAQLGTADELDDKEFARRVAEMTIRIVVPQALRDAASIHPMQSHKDAIEAAAVRCEKEGGDAAASDASYAARAAASAAASAALAAASDAASDASYASYAASDASYDASDAARAAALAAASAAASAASAASDASDAASAASDARLSTFAETVVQILVAMGGTAIKWLDLTNDAN